METILWAQNENPSKKGTFIIDGKITVYEGTDEQDKAFSLLLSMTEKKEEKEEKSEFNLLEMAKKLFTRPENKGKKASPSPSYFEDENGIYIQSVYKEVDDAGRKMPFMFYTNKKDIESACKKLEEYSAKINRHCREADLKYLKDCSSKKNS